MSFVDHDAEHLVQTFGKNESLYKFEFLLALSNNDYVKQINLSLAYFVAITRNQTSCQDIFLYPREFNVYYWMYEAATSTKFSYPSYEITAKKVFQEAAKLHFIPAIITLLHNEWKWYTSCYGFALALKPYLGFSRVNYLFGNALFNCSKPGSNLYFLGLSWKKPKTKVLCPKKEEDFETFVEHARSSCSATYYWYGGLFFMNDNIYAPSIELWNEFCDQHVHENPSSDIANIDMNSTEITSIIKTNKLTFIACGENSETIIVVYQDHKRLGEIGVHQETKTVQRRLSHMTNIEKVVHFIESALVITLYSGSVAHWLHKLSC
jgi:hypothetical protein